MDIQANNEMITELQAALAKLKEGTEIELKEKYDTISKLEAESGNQLNV